MNHLLISWIMILDVFFETPAIAIYTLIHTSRMEIIFCSLRSLGFELRFACTKSVNLIISGCEYDLYRLKDYSKLSHDEIWVLTIGWKGGKCGLWMRQDVGQARQELTEGASGCWEGTAEWTEGAPGWTEGATEWRRCARMAKVCQNGEDWIVNSLTELMGWAKMPIVFVN